MVRTRALSRATVGKRDALREHARFEQVIRQLHRQRSVADDDRRDRALAEAGIEAERVQARLEEPGVVPQPLDDLRFLLEDVDRREARGGDRRRMRRREQERPGAMVQELDQRCAAGHVAAEGADRLRQRADLDVDAAVHARSDRSCRARSARTRRSRGRRRPS